MQSFLAELDENPEETIAFLFAQVAASSEPLEILAQPFMHLAQTDSSIFGDYEEDAL